MCIFWKLLASLGIVWIVMYGDIIAPVRRKLLKFEFFQRFLKCALCIGFWSGVLIFLFNRSLPYEFPFMSAAFCWFIQHVRRLLDDCMCYLENK